MTDRLLDSVRPSDWVNPAPRGRYDLVVLGGGTAGLVSAMGAVGLGARVALIEHERLGGDCMVTDARRRLKCSGCDGEGREPGFVDFS